MAPSTGARNPTGESTPARARTPPRTLRDHGSPGRTRRDRKCWRISGAPPKEETGGLPEADGLSRTWSLGDSGQRGNPGSNRGRPIRMLGARVLEKQPVVLYGARRLVGLIVQLRKIVMRGSISGCTVQGIEQSFFGRVEVAGAAVDQREVDERVQIARVDRQGRLKLCRGVGGASQHQQRGAVVVVRPAVPRVDGNGPLQFTSRFLELPPFLVEESQVVVCLRVQIVAVEQGTVALQRVRVVSRPVVVKCALEIVVLRHG